MKRRALVTGASAGLGLAAASALAGRGIDVTLVARNLDRLAAARDAIFAQGAQVDVEVRVADLEFPASVKTLLDEQVRHGAPDILVHVAGGPPLYVSGSETEEDFRRFLESHSMSLWTLVRAFAPVMQEQGFGRVIAVMSRAVGEPRADNPLSAAVRLPAWAMIKSYSKAPKFSKVTFNAVLPGLFDTDRFRDVCVALADQTGGTIEEERARFISAIPAGRLGRPNELGAVCAFLASDEAGYINGQRVVIDGGSSSSL